MSKNIWDDEEQFRDGAPVFENGQWKETETYIPVPDNEIRANKIKEAQALAAQYQIEEAEESDQGHQEENEDEDDYTEVLSDARLRLEQGKLYEMIMNHSLFDGVDSDPRAVKIVQKQIHKVAKELMEVMLGMRQPVTQSTHTISPFNTLEVEVLKELASAASKGATKTEEANTFVAKQEVQPSKKKTLNSIGMPKQQPKAKPIQKKAEPIQRKPQIRNTLPPEFEPDYEPLNKPIHEMSPEELVERDRQALERQRARKSAIPADRAPMPDYATQEMLALSQVSRATNSNLKGSLSALIVANLKNSGKI